MLRGKGKVCRFFVRQVRLFHPFKLTGLHDFRGAKCGIRVVLLVQVHPCHQPFHRVVIQMHLPIQQIPVIIRFRNGFPRVQRVTFQIIRSSFQIFQNHPEHIRHRPLREHIRRVSRHVRNSHLRRVLRVTCPEQTQQIKMQESTCSQSLPFNHVVIHPGKHRLLPVNLLQQLVGIRYRVIQPVPYRVNPNLRSCVLVFVILIVIIIRRLIIPLLCQHTQHPESQLFPVKTLLRHDAINTRKGFLEPALGRKQIFILHLRLRFNIQPVITRREHQPNQAETQVFSVIIYSISHHYILLSLKSSLQSKRISPGKRIFQPPLRLHRRNPEHVRQVKRQLQTFHELRDIHVPEIIRHVQRGKRQFVQSLHETACRAGSRRRIGNPLEKSNIPRFLPRPREHPSVYVILYIHVLHPVDQRLVVIIASQLVTERTIQGDALVFGVKPEISLCFRVIPRTPPDR